ncbi:MAG TPA: antitoxin Xre/MbcA/ParS toxin-binding domain-containing protein [Candidatus Angelobacter sp.]|nr:antitoxin Xre/MbcA/ParS toxin-binding domain-containing protein [Candidatus Angelobacter sp.]
MSRAAKKEARAMVHDVYHPGHVAKSNPIRYMGGVVDYYLSQGKGSGDFALREGHEMSLDEIIGQIRAGLSILELEHLQAGLEVSNDTLAPMLGISRATIHRIKGKGREKRLDPAVSDRVVRFARLMGKAIDVFGSRDDARKWLSSPQFGLGGAVPFDYATTELGAREVEDLLGRIEHGVYS